MPGRVVDKDLGYKDFLASFGEVGGVELVVGVLDDEEYPDGTPVSVVAAANEFGTETVPERSYFRTTLAENAGSYARQLQHEMSAVVTGRTTTTEALDRLGGQIVTDVQRKIIDLRDPANAAATLAGKDGSNPLVDTMLLHDSITHDVRKVGS